MREASKTIRLLTDGERRALTGRGLDIGAGNDPIRPDVQRFDVEHGDANRVTASLQETAAFDYVFSSHCLEHLRDPAAALADWWRLVKPGGMLLVVVPDEDLYEQGYWPSLFNSDHKFTFTISKPSSWSPVSRNLLDLVHALPGAERVSARVQDDGYRYTRLAPAAWPRGVARQAVRVHHTVARAFPWLGASFDSLYPLLRLPVDQTIGSAVAQAVLVAFKSADGEPRRAPSPE